jgi:hypothetical protein
MVEFGLITAWLGPGRQPVAAITELVNGLGNSIT